MGGFAALQYYINTHPLPQSDTKYILLAVSIFFVGTIILFFAARSSRKLVA